MIAASAILGTLAIIGVGVRRDPSTSLDS